LPPCFALESVHEFSTSRHRSSLSQIALLNRTMGHANTPASKLFH
jgi:hypothetical protein